MNSAERIVIYRLGSLGDTCVALPAFRVVRRRYPGAHITLLTNLPVNRKAAPAPALLEGMGLIDDFVPYPTATRSPVRLGALAWRLRRGRTRLAVNLAAFRGHGALRRDDWFFRVAGARQRIGFDADDSHELRSIGDGTTEREAMRILRRVASLGAADLNSPHWFGLDLAESERRQGDDTLRNAGIDGGFVAFSTGTKAAVNDWGERNWRDVMGRLRATLRGAGAVFVGAADEAARADSYLEGWPGPRANLCGRLTPRSSAAVLARASVFVGHDSGPMHLAAAAGARCVAVFSGRNPPGQWFPLGDGHVVLYRRTECGGCGLVDCVTEKKRCILCITVAEVHDAIVERWWASR